MGSKPITAIAKMKSYENSVAKKIGDPIDPPKSRTENVRDENNDLLTGNASFSMGADQIIVTPGDTTYGWSGPLDNTGQYYERLRKEEGFKNFQGTIKEYEQSKLKKMAETGNANVTQQQGESTTTTVPGSRLAEFAYKPQTREADTFEIREARKRDRNIKRAGRVMNRDLKKYGKTSAEYKSSKAAYDRYLRERTEGVNPYNTARSKENIKAPEGTQTKSEFESKFGGGDMGVVQTKSFTPGTIDFSTPTMPSSSRTISDFSGSGSYLNRGPQPTNEQQLQNFFSLKNNPPAIGTKRGYKMGGYGNKNK